MIIILSGEPKSTQHIYGLVCNGRPRRYMTDQGRALKERYQWEARARHRMPADFNFETACRVRRRDKSYLWRGHNRERPLLHNTQRNVYLATQAIRFKSKSSLAL